MACCQIIEESEEIYEEGDVEQEPAPEPSPPPKARPQQSNESGDEITGLHILLPYNVSNKAGVSPTRSEMPTRELSNPRSIHERSSGSPQARSSFRSSGSPRAPTVARSPADCPSQGSVGPGDSRNRSSQQQLTRSSRATGSSLGSFGEESGPKDEIECRCYPDENQPGREMKSGLEILLPGRASDGSVVKRGGPGPLRWCTRTPTQPAPPGQDEEDSDAFEPTPEDAAEPWVPSYSDASQSSLQRTPQGQGPPVNLASTQRGRRQWGAPSCEPCSDGTGEVTIFQAPAPAQEPWAPWAPFADTTLASSGREECTPCEDSNQPAPNVAAWPAFQDDSAWTPFENPNQQNSAREECEPCEDPNQRSPAREECEPCEDPIQQSPAREVCAPCEDPILATPTRGSPQSRSPSPMRRSPSGQSPGRRAISTPVREGMQPPQDYSMSPIGCPPNCGPGSRSPQSTSQGRDIQGNRTTYLTVAPEQEPRESTILDSKAVDEDESRYIWEGTNNMFSSKILNSNRYHPSLDQSKIGEHGYNESKKNLQKDINQDLRLIDFRERSVITNLKNYQGRRRSRVMSWPRLDQSDVDFGPSFGQALGQVPRQASGQGSRQGSGQGSRQDSGRCSSPKCPSFGQHSL